jgi:hypothetical protein
MQAADKTKYSRTRNGSYYNLLLNAAGKYGPEASKLITKSYINST